MTDTSAPNPAPGTPGAQAPQSPAIRVLGQYVKDLSFENPGNVQVNTQPNIDLGIDVSATPHEQGNNIFEVSLRLKAQALAEDKTLFITELDYAGLFQIQGANDTEKEAMLLIECPRLLFPFARRIIAEITREGGFPPLMIDPVDFVGLYQSQKAQAQGGQAPAQPTPPQA